LQPMDALAFIALSKPPFIDICAPMSNGNFFVTIKIKALFL
jgi:hypothetical protein